MIINKAKTKNTVNYFFDSVRGVFETAESFYSEAFGAWIQNNADTLIIVDADLDAKSIDSIFEEVLV